MSPSELLTDVLVVGGGLGGVAAALTAAKLGRRVVLTEETDWLGGQLTSQAVPPDEHRWIETAHTSPSYRRLRHGIRAYYRRNYPLNEKAAADRELNPGLGFVSRLCHEPRVAVAALEEMLSPHIAASRLRILHGYRPVAVRADGDRVETVTLRPVFQGKDVAVSAAYVVDATELGDLLELASVEFVIGAESRDETGEPHGAEKANPLDQQAVTWCFALEYRAGESHVIDRPAGYARWRDFAPDFWPGPQLSWTDIEPISLTARTRPIFTGPADDPRLMDLWHYRRVFARTQYAPGFADSDVTVVNWPQNDYWETPLLGVDDDTRRAALSASRDLSLSLLYWMQTEAPRPDGGTGYPGLRLRPDVTGTADGLAKAVYVRESRRIRALFTVAEQHIGVAARPPGAGSAVFPDTVGLGSYRIDLHPSTAGRTYVDVDCYPFQIPLGALLPVRMRNLLPANKNIGTTHVTNGAYRLHPVEWSVGEAVGALASFCLDTKSCPHAVREDQTRLNDYQRLLSDGLGIALSWPDEIRRSRS